MPGSNSLPEPDKRRKKQADARRDHPPAEDEYGGGDFCSPELSPPTEDDRPLE